MEDIRLLDFPGHTIRLERDVEAWSDEHLRLARLALDSVFAFSENLCVPLSMEVHAPYWNDEFDLPLDSTGGPMRPLDSAMLRQRPLPEGLTANPFMRGRGVTEVGALTPGSTRDFMAACLTAGADDLAGVAIGWQEMWICTTKVRLPEAVDRVGPFLTLDIGGGRRSRQPVETDGAARWVRGAVGPAVVHAPFEYRVHRHQGTMTFDISLHWSLWTPGGPGYAEIERRLTDLLRAGWERA
ncbi:MULTISPECIES: hypothetical protein [Streptomyces]|uniref:Uncharacterized protein n=1 Tax=Streptomyces ramulosus TaxID=47762 RepID=A0ABW1FK59_9ACTN